MGIVNWLVHRSITSAAEALVTWATDAYRSVRTAQPDLPEREVFGHMLDRRGRLPDGDKGRDTVLDRYGSSIHGLCYFLGLNAHPMKGMMVSRCLQFTEYVDLELRKRGFDGPADDVKRRYFRTLGLPENAVAESHL